MYDNTNASPTNRVTLTGRISSEPRYSHEIYGEAFYEFSLEVKRLSDMADTLPVVVSERLLLCCEVKVGKNVTVVGQLRSYNKLVEDKSRLMLNVFVRDIYDADRASTPNAIELHGFLCKPPVFRTTPFNREICDILLAVNRAYNKSDYIPAIAWGRNAGFAKYLSVGEEIEITGRLQSREYQKKISEEVLVTKVAYEVSISKIDVIGAAFKAGDFNRRFDPTEAKHAYGMECGGVEIGG